MFARIARMFELEASWKERPPSDIKRLRETHRRVHLDSFFAWAEVEHEDVAGSDDHAERDGVRVQIRAPKR